MKKKFMCLLCLLVLALTASAMPLTGALAAEAEWTVTNGTAEGTVLTASGEEDMTAKYSEPLDLNAGVVIRYDIEEFTLNSEVIGRWGKKTIR